MKDKEVAKTAFEQAEKEAQEKKVKLVKEIVKATLEKLETIKGKIKELQEEKKILELDIEDIKQGKLQRIVDRQKIDPKSKETSVVVIVKEKETNNYWNTPYIVEKWNWPTYPIPTIYCNGISSAGNFVSTDLSNFTNSNNLISINCSVARDSAIDTYSLSDGHKVHLR